MIEVLENYANPAKDDTWYPWHFLTILTGVEVLIILIALSWYLGKINLNIKSYIVSLFFF